MNVTPCPGCTLIFFLQTIWDRLQALCNHPELNEYKKNGWIEQSKCFSTLNKALDSII